MMCKLKAFSQSFKEKDIKEILSESASDMNQEINFEDFLKVMSQSILFCTSILSLGIKALTMFVSFLNVTL